MAKASTKGTVLIVDDQEHNIQVVGTTLSDEGYTVMAASGGDQVLDRIAARCPDLILLDIYMPDVDGFEVCERLRANPQTAELPIIFLSAADEKDVIVRALEAGGVDYITKPFNHAELLARVHTHVALKLARDEREKLIRERENFISMMAHDLKNPLGGAQFSTKMLVEAAAGLPDKAQRLAHNADEGIGRALDLIEKFLGDAQAASIAHSIQPHTIDLAACAAAAVDRQRLHAANKSIELHWQHPLCEVPALGDEDALARVLDNLIGNAIKFSPSGRSVWLTLAPETRTLSVRDEGPGFTAEDRGKLYQSFVRLSAKPTAQETSTGLGLNVAKRLTEAMGGEIGLSDAHETGAEFEVRLPRPQGA